MNSGYQVEYVPPNQSNYVPSQHSEVGLAHNPMSASNVNNQVMTESNYNPIEISKKIKINDVSVSNGEAKDMQFGSVNAFR